MSSKESSESVASSSGNRTLERAAAILDALGTAAASVSASELARRTGLSVSTTHRLAASMAEYGFLRRSDSGNFRLGHRFVRTTLESSALPLLEELQETTGETAQLWIRRGNERICVLTVDSDHELRATLPPGSRLQLPAGSSGRLLAGEPDALQELKAAGWVESAGRRTPGLGSVSAPVQTQGNIIAAICLAMPLARVAVSPGADYGDAVAQTAQRIGDELEGIGR